MVEEVEEFHVPKLNDTDSENDSDKEVSFVIHFLNLFCDIVATDNLCLANV